MLGICNGFQVMVKLGLLPWPRGWDAADAEVAPGPAQSVTLTDNRSGSFVTRWTRLRSEPAGPCVWTRALADSHDTPAAFELPVAHAEGRFTAPPDVLDQLDHQGLVPLRYEPDDNPNGSDRDIAGICDPTGLIFGLMPHPERYVTANQHYAWSRLVHTRADEPEPVGLRLIRAGVVAAGAAASGVGAGDPTMAQPTPGR